MQKLILMLMCLGIVWSATSTAVAAPQPDKLISYSTEQKSVQYVVIDLAKMVGLGYNFQKSFEQTDPECRRWVRNLSIKNKPFEKVMKQVLGPVGLSYTIEDDKVVLFRR